MPRQQRTKVLRKVERRIGERVLRSEGVPTQGQNGQGRSFRRSNRFDQVPQRNLNPVRRGVFGRRPGARRQNVRSNTPITRIGRVLREGGGVVGGLLGSSTLGRLAGTGISRIFGQGDYITNTPMRNSLMGAGGPPAFSPLTSGFRIQHREYIKDIQSSVSFATQSFVLNPGMSQLFPWLAPVAANFEEYTIHGAVIYLNTTSGTAVASTNTALGLWGVVTQYDPTDPDFLTKQQAENYVGCQSAVPFQSLMHGIECQPRANVLQKHFVRTGPVGDEDLKFYDWGKVQVFTTGSQAVSTIGEMWISYDIEFFKPRLETGPMNVDADYYYNASGTTAGNILSPSAGTIYPSTTSTLGTTVGGNSGIIFPAAAPPGLYVISLHVDMGSVGTNAGFTGFTVGGTAGTMTAFNLFSSSSASYVAAPQLTTSQRWNSIQMAVRKNDWAVGWVTPQISGTWVAGNYNMTVTRMPDTFLPITKDKQDMITKDELCMLKKLFDKYRAVDANLFAVKDSPDEENEEQKISKEKSDEFIL